MQVTQTAVILRIPLTWEGIVDHTAADRDGLGWEVSWNGKSRQSVPEGGHGRGTLGATRLGGGVIEDKRSTDAEYPPPPLPPPPPRFYMIDSPAAPGLYEH